MTVAALEGWEGEVRIQTEKEWAANVSWGNCTEPYLTSAPFDTDVAMEKIYVIGSRNAVDTVEGVIDITGSIERPFFESGERNKIIWDGTVQKTLAETSGLYGTNVTGCTMKIKPVSNQTIVLHNVKFHSYGFGLAQGEITTERADFTADNVSTG